MSDIIAQLLSLSLRMKGIIRRPLTPANFHDIGKQSDATTFAGHCIDGSGRLTDGDHARQIDHAKRACPHLPNQAKMTLAICDLLARPPSIHRPVLATLASPLISRFLLVCITGSTYKQFLCPHVYAPFAMTHVLS